MSITWTGFLTRALYIPKISDTLESDVIIVLPAIHTLSECDSMCKNGGEKTILKMVEGGLAESLSEFCK